MAPRTELGVLLEAVRRHGPEPAPLPEAGAAAEIRTLLAERGALFLDEIVTATRRLPQDVEQGLRVLIGAGLLTADGVQPLRDVAGRHRGGAGRRRGPRRRPLAPWRLTGGSPAGASEGAEPRVFLRGRPSGRWSLLDAHVPLARDGELDTEALAEETARVLLDRWGVVFRDLALRESFTVPWREVLRALRRLEARGLVRGGRFVTGPHGEQFALPEAVEALRRVRREPHNSERVIVPAVDPLNLTGGLLPGLRVPSQPGRSVVLVDGVPETVAEVPASAGTH
jgi:ATP-dependent Lhr-like helicase